MLFFPLTLLSLVTVPNAVQKYQMLNILKLYKIENEKKGGEHHRKRKQ